MPLFGSLYIGASGLQTSQNAMNTTAHNMTNVDTKGYTRQQILLNTRTYQTLSVNASAVAYQQYGLGVYYSQTRQVRDMFLDNLLVDLHQLPAVIVQLIHVFLNLRIQIILHLAKAFIYQRSSRQEFIAAGYEKILIRHIAGIHIQILDCLPKILNRFGKFHPLKLSEQIFERLRQGAGADQPADYESRSGKCGKCQ